MSRTRFSLLPRGRGQERWTYGLPGRNAVTQARTCVFCDLEEEQSLPSFFCPTRRAFVLLCPVVSPPAGWARDAAGLLADEEAAGRSTNGVSGSLTREHLVGGRTSISSEGAYLCCSCSSPTPCASEFDRCIRNRMVTHHLLCSPGDLTNPPLELLEVFEQKPRRCHEDPGSRGFAPSCPGDTACGRN